MIIRTVIEFLLIVFTVACVANEEKIAEWEQKAFRKGETE